MEGPPVMYYTDDGVLIPPEVVYGPFDAAIHVADNIPDLHAPVHGADIDAPVHGAGIDAPVHLHAPVHGADIDAPVHGAGIDAPVLLAAIDAPVHLHAPVHGADIDAPVHGADIDAPVHGADIDAPVPLAYQPFVARAAMANGNRFALLADLDEEATFEVCAPLTIEKEISAKDIGSPQGVKVRRQRATPVFKVDQSVKKLVLSRETVIEVEVPCATRTGSLRQVRKLAQSQKSGYVCTSDGPGIYVWGSYGPSSLEF